MRLRFCSIWALFACSAVLVVGCQKDLDESAYDFACEGNADCAGSWECLPSDDYETDICQPPREDASDAGDTGDVSDAEQDAADTSDASDGSDGDTGPTDTGDAEGDTDSGDADGCTETNEGIEQCDGVDNDCDGEIDEPFDFRAKIVENGDDHACAVSTDDEVYCWGDNTSGKAIPGTDGEDLDYVRRPMRVSGISSDASIDDLALGPNHTCALQDGTRVYCWGDHSRKQLGLGAPVSGELTDWSTEDISVASVSSFSDIEAGNDFSCGRAGDGNLYCWGATSRLRMGVDVNDLSVAQPVQLDTGKDVDVFDLGATHGCGIDQPQLQGTSFSEVLCWGANDFSQVGVSEMASRLPIEPSLDFGEGEPNVVGLMSVEAGNTATCGLNGAALLCWGDNNTGQLAVSEDSTTQPEAVSVQPPGAYSVPLPGVDEAFLAMGARHGCALASNRRAFCWGDGRQGQLGDGQPGAIRYETVKVDSTSSFDSITAGGEFTCAVEEWGDAESGGQVYCWGANGSHQLGLGESGDPVNSYAVPQPVACAFEDTGG